LTEYSNVFGETHTDRVPLICGDGLVFIDTIKLVSLEHPVREFVVLTVTESIPGFVQNTSTVFSFVDPTIFPFIIDPH
jgi:hypothetical protein